MLSMRQTAASKAEWLGLLAVLGLAGLVFFSQADTLTNRITGLVGLPIFKLLTAGVVGLALIRGLPSPSLPLPRLTEYGAIGAVLFGLVSFFGVFLADDKALAISAVERLASLLALFFLCLTLIRKRWHLWLVMGAIIAASGFSGLIVVLDSLLGTTLLGTADAAVTAQWEDINRSAGASDSNPTTAAAMIVAGTLMACVFAVEAEGRLRTAALAAAGLGALGIIFSFARSAMLSAAMVGLMMAYFYRMERAFPAAVMLGALIVLAMLPFIPEAYWERLGTLVGLSEDKTLDRRLSYNIIGLQLFLENPVFGVGPGNFEHHYTDPRFRYIPGRTWLPRQLHNTYLSALVEFGLIGFSCFMLVLGGALKQIRTILMDRAYAAYHRSARALLFGFSSFLICCLFLPGVDYKYIWIFPALCFALGRLAERDAGAQNTHTLAPTSASSLIPATAG